MCGESQREFQRTSTTPITSRTEVKARRTTN